VIAAAMTIAAPAIAPPLAPKDIRVVKATEIALADQPSVLANPGNVYIGAYPARDAAEHPACRASSSNH
jgi:hypothetical protein